MAFSVLKGAYNASLAALRIGIDTRAILPGIIPKHATVIIKRDYLTKKGGRAKKRQTNELLHTPNFDEYDKLPGDQYQTVYKGFYDDQRHTDPRGFERFYRLNWGGWIRARGGRGTAMWRSTGPRTWWVKQHVLCGEHQSKILEQMFEKKYRKKTYFVDDPYEVYETRDFEFLPQGTAPYSYNYIKARDYDS